MHQFRRFNRFNVADLFALGGSGLGSHQPIRFTVSSQAVEWARTRVAASRTRGLPLVVVQVSASKAKKTWRPEYFGQTMAALSRETPCVFVLTGTANDAIDVAIAVAAYHAAGGTSECCDIMRTDRRATTRGITEGMPISAGERYRADASGGRRGHRRD